MAANRFDRLIAQLASHFGAVAKAMSRVVLGFVGGYASLDEANSAVDEAAAALNNEAERWAEETLPQVYAEGVHGVLASPQTGDVAVSGLAAPLHDTTLSLLQQDLTDVLAAATDNMSRDAKADLRDIARSRVSAALAGGGRAASEEMARQMEERGVAFVDKSGRRWDPQQYSEMVLRDAVTDTLNEGHLNTAVELGSPGVRVHDGLKNSDEACRLADGQAWSLEYALLHKREHPNCRRTFSPLPTTFDGKLDK